MTGKQKKLLAMLLDSGLLSYTEIEKKLGITRESANNFVNRLLKGEEKAKPFSKQETDREVIVWISSDVQDEILEKVPNHIEWFDMIRRRLFLLVWCLTLPVSFSLILLAQPKLLWTVLDVMNLNFPLLGRSLRFRGEGIEVMLGYLCPRCQTHWQWTVDAGIKIEGK